MKWFALAFIVLVAGGICSDAFQSAISIPPLNLTIVLGSVLSCLQYLLQILILTFTGLLGQNTTCELVFNEVLSLLPTNTSNLLSNASTTQCSANACGQPDGTGYWDIYCNAQCVAAQYSSGVCAKSGTGIGGGYCTCSGSNGIPNAQTLYALCQLLGSCACQTCQADGGSGKWSSGQCTQLPNGVQNTCIS